VLFSDIRGFSKLAESLDPEDLATFLNQYLTPMTQIVLDSSGTLDKYIGDAVMAIWGAPIDLTDHAERACAAALAMLERLAAMNQTTRGPKIAIGIGINTGTMAVGNMGSEARFDYTVLGDAVNLGARLEALTKEYAVDILCGEATAQAAGARFSFREIDWVRVKGREGSAPVFELCTSKPDAAYADGLAAYRARDFDRAIELWGDLALAGDRTAAIMRARADALRADPPPADWDGVYEQRSK
jgi:adenylate cyclase